MSDERWVRAYNFPDYEVSDLGNVRRVGRTKPLRFNNGGKLTNSYHAVRLYKNKRCYKRVVHRLVFESFIHPVPAGFVVDHINHDRYCNLLSNLQCITPLENERRKPYRPVLRRDWHGRFLKKEAA